MPNKEISDQILERINDPIPRIDGEIIFIGDELEERFDIHEFDDLIWGHGIIGKPYCKIENRRINVISVGLIDPYGKLMGYYHKESGTILIDKGYEEKFKRRLERISRNGKNVTNKDLMLSAFFARIREDDLYQEHFNNLWNQLFRQEVK